jgi:hypothetical protein
MILTNWSISRTNGVPPQNQAPLPKAKIAMRINAKNILVGTQSYVILEVLLWFRVHIFLACPHLGVTNFRHQSLTL